jgi:hypothetical protein
MKSNELADRVVTKVYIMAFAALAILINEPSVAANEGIPLQLGGGLGYYAKLFEHSPGNPFKLPAQAITRDGKSGLNLNGQPTVNITDIRGFYHVNGVLIKGLGGTEEIKADVEIGYQVNDSEVYPVSSANFFPEWNNGAGGVINATPKVVPAGSDTPIDNQTEYKDVFFPSYNFKSLRAAFAYIAPGSFVPSSIATVTEDDATDVVKKDDPVPDRADPAPPGTGDLFTSFDSFSISVNASYIGFKGYGDFFSGGYTEEIATGVVFRAVESDTLDPNRIGDIGGFFLYGDNDDVVFDAAGGDVYWGSAKGLVPPELKLAKGTEVLPMIIYGGGLLHHVAGDHAVVAGSDGNFNSTIWLIDLDTYTAEPVVQQGDTVPDSVFSRGPAQKGAPSAGTFGLVQRPGVSDEMVVFEGFDENFQFLGLFAYLIETRELKAIVRVGEIFDGKEVRTVSFQPGALYDSVVGFVAFFTDGSSGAYLTTPVVDFTVPFGNISTRLAVGIGDDAGIGGFINTPKPGTNQTVPLDVGAKQVVIRAIGPSLGAFGVAGPLADPVLELHDATGALIISNDNWRDTQEQEIMDTGLAPTDDLESAILTTLELGAYTAIVRGSNGSSGVGLVEIYDLDGAAASELGNISTRGSVQTGDGVMIGGFIVGGTESTASTMVVRAIGPSLTAFGVADALQDPTLELHDGSGALIASNDNWKDTQQTALETAGLAPTDDREAALEIALGPGLYTALVRGAGDTTGVALVEAYNLEASGAPAAVPVSLTNRR